MQNTLGLPLPPKKRGRGRPANRTINNMSDTAIAGSSSEQLGKGEVTIPITVQSTEEQSAFELSEATAKQGFCASPVMRLSPSKDAKRGNVTGSGTGIGTIGPQTSKCKSSDKMRVLHEINNESNTNSGSGTGAGARVRARDETSRSKDISQGMMHTFDLSMNTNNKRKREYKNDFSFSSSPLQDSLHSSGTNIMTSEIGDAPSSPYGTSPLHSDRVKQLPQFTQFQATPRVNDHHDDDHFYKFINSSPVCSPNTPKRRQGSPQHRKQQQEQLESVIVSSPQYSAFTLRDMENKWQRKLDLNRYRFNYQYKVSVNISDDGEARIFMRVLDNRLSIPQTYGGAIKQGKKKHYYEWPGEWEINDDDDDGDDDDDDDAVNEGYGGRSTPVNVPSFVNVEGYVQALAPGKGHGVNSTLASGQVQIRNRYDEYVKERLEFDAKRVEMLKNCMKSDAFMTTNQYFTPYNGFRSGRDLARRIEKNAGGAEMYVGTVNLENTIRSRNVGISAGFDGCGSGDGDEADIENINTLNTNTTTNSTDDKAAMCNDALAALAAAAFAE
jgi:hypothetical protein